MGNWLVDELIASGTSYEETCALVARALEKPIRVLAAKRVLGQASELQAELDEICHETAERLGMPTVLVTLIDDANVQFIGVYGTEQRAGPIDKSVCQITVSSDSPLVVADAFEMVTVPIVTANAQAANARSYFGAPWHASNQPIGTVCAFGPNPKVWTDEEKAFVETQAARVEELVAQLG